MRKGPLARNTATSRFQQDVSDPPEGFGGMVETNRRGAARFETERIFRGVAVPVGGRGVDFHLVESGRRRLDLGRPTPRRPASRRFSRCVDATRCTRRELLGLAVALLPTTEPDRRRKRTAVFAAPAATRCRKKAPRSRD